MSDPEKLPPTQHTPHEDIATTLPHLDKAAEHCLLRTPDIKVLPTPWLFYLVCALTAVTSATPESKTWIPTSPSEASATIYLYSFSIGYIVTGILLAISFKHGGRK
ncbi:hypothetical protein BDU57DRAFT_293360 [Ampelomyces quisqualis]|uniref:Uncharacterized protein n=1 Tax=Ampelomyces quisqualis TaxID=50730 RepID=A0A6A5QG72_AMPQU|nr:hypothetical protein BDU57DRAFT_293360 [Ampelomyces quisqualis]